MAVKERQGGEGQPIMKWKLFCMKKLRIASSMVKRKFELSLLKRANLKTLRLRKVGFQNFVGGTKQQQEKTFCALKIDYFPLFASSKYLFGPGQSMTLNSILFAGTSFKFCLQFHS